MNRALVTGVLAATLALAWAPAAFAAKPTATEKKLMKQIAALQKDVKTLKKQVNDATNFGIAGLQLGFCNTAVTADAFQGTWSVIDQIAQGTQAGKTYFGAQVPVNDFNICQRALEVPRSQRVPPTTTPFAQILALLGGSFAYATGQLEGFRWSLFS
jgi:hypothetical protein